MRRKYSKAMKKRTLAVTNTIYNDSVREVMGLYDESEEDLLTAIDFVRNANRYYSDIYSEEELKDMVEAKEAVSNLYLQKVLGLSSQQLEEIITVHNEGAINRAPKTIDAILSELARRSIFDDSIESDNRYNYGAVNGHKTKSKIGGKKATVKRRKASKNR